MTALRAGIETLTAEIRKRDADLEARETRASESTAALRKEIDTKLDGLSSELRESDQLLREEQRVCFKQLSLEASEASVSADRGRRVIESRLDDLEKSVSNSEK